MIAIIFCFVFELQAAHLDGIKKKILENCPSAFFEEKLSLHRSLETELLVIAKNLGVQVRLVSSVTAAVQLLPFHPTRLKVCGDEKIEGWFDEYTNPRLILLQKNSTAMTLLHEIRHAYHLGQTDTIFGANRIDQLLIQADHSKIVAKNIIEDASEIVAYQDERDLYEGCGYDELAQDSRSFQRDYIRTFLKKLRMPKNHLEARLKLAIQNLGRNN